MFRHVYRYFQQRETARNLLTLPCFVDAWPLHGFLAFSATSSATSSATWLLLGLPLRLPLRLPRLPFRLPLLILCCLFGSLAAPSAASLAALRAASAASSAASSIRLSHVWLPFAADALRVYGRSLVTTCCGCPPRLHPHPGVREFWGRRLF